MIFKRKNLEETRRGKLAKRISNARRRCPGVEAKYSDNADAAYICRCCEDLLAEGGNIVLQLLPPRDLNAEEIFLDQAFDLIRNIENSLNSAFRFPSVIETELFPAATELKDLIIEYAKS